MKTAVCGFVLLILASSVAGQCTNCYPGSSGPCKNTQNNVCYSYQTGTTCYAGTTPCTGTPATPAPTTKPPTTTTKPPATPATPAPATPAPTSAPASIQGIYWWTWSTSVSPPSGTNVGVAFSGWANPTNALSDSASVKNSLPGTKYISLGGGNVNGAWTASILNTVTSKINNNDFSGWQGIVFDVEEGDSGLATAFGNAFQAAKNKGLKVIVTVSHSAPYNVPDASTLMNSFFASTNIDYISPQLYTTGTETSNDYTTSGGVAWSQYKNSKAKVAPSIVRGSLYNAAKTYFAQTSIGVTTYGYIQWAQS